MWKDHGLRSLSEVKLVRCLANPNLGFANDAMHKRWDRKSNRIVKVQFITILFAQHLTKVKLMEVPPGSKTLVVGRAERIGTFIYNYYREMFKSCQKVRRMRFALTVCMCNLNESFQDREFSKLFVSLDKANWRDDHLKFIGPKESLSGGVLTSQVHASATCPYCFNKTSLPNFTTNLYTCDVKQGGYDHGAPKFRKREGNMSSRAFKHSSVKTVNERGLVYSLFSEEKDGSDSSDDSEDENLEEAEEQDFASGSDSEEEKEEEEELKEEGEEDENEEDEGEEEEEEKAEEEENETIILVSVKDSQDPASKLAGMIKLYLCSNHEYLLKAIQKILAKHTKKELHGDGDGDVSFENVWPGYTLKYYSYEEKLLPSPNVMDWKEVVDLLGSILAVEEEEEEENAISINLVNEEGNIENIGSLNLDECHDHRDFVASVHCTWVKYTGNDPQPLHTINASTAWPGFKVTYLQQCNEGFSPFDPCEISWTDVENLLHKIIVEREEKNDSDEKGMKKQNKD